jgi:hypothetical protein
VIALAGLEVVNDNVLNKIRRFGDFHNRVLLKFYGRNIGISNFLTRDGKYWI